MGYNVATLVSAREGYLLDEALVEPAVDDLRANSKDLTLLQIEDHQCKYPYGKEPPYLFCGNDVQDDSSYCPGHFAITRKGDPNA